MKYRLTDFYHIGHGIVRWRTFHDTDDAYVMLLYGNPHDFVLQRIH